MMKILMRVVILTPIILANLDCAALALALPKNDSQPEDFASNKTAKNDTRDKEPYSSDKNYFLITVGVVAIIMLICYGVAFAVDACQKNRVQEPSYRDIMMRENMIRNNRIRGNRHPRDRWNDRIRERDCPFIGLPGTFPPVIQEMPAPVPEFPQLLVGGNGLTLKSLQSPRFAKRVTISNPIMFGTSQV